MQLTELCYVSPFVRPCLPAASGRKLVTDLSPGFSPPDLNKRFRRRSARKLTLCKGEHTILSMKKVTVCGCGNASQLMAALISHEGKHEVYIYAPFQDEAARFRAAVEKSPDHAIEVTGPGENASFVAKMDPSKVTESAEVAITGADLILLPLPAFAVGPTFHQISPYLKNGAFVGVLPGQGGCQWTATKAFGANFYSERGIVLFATEKLPYNVRVLEYGRKIRVFAYKRVGIGAVPPKSAEDAVNLLKETVPFTDAVALHSILVTTLTTGNQCIHPPRVHSLSEAKTPFTYKPMFYEEMDEPAANDIQAISDEIAAIAKKVQSEVPSVELSGVLDVRTALLEAYGNEVEDSSTLLAVLKTTKGFKGIPSPMKENEKGEWVVDWYSRYITDDVPYGLCVLRGIAELVNVPTPTVDSLILWAQSNMNKSYLVDGKLCGEDVKSTGAPQAFGYDSLKSLPEIEA